MKKIWSSKTPHQKATISMMILAAIGFAGFCYPTIAYYLFIVMVMLFAVGSVFFMFVDIYNPSSIRRYPPPPEGWRPQLPEVKNTPPMTPVKPPPRVV